MVEAFYGESKEKILSYDDWKMMGGCDKGDNYGHYAEYVVTAALNNLGINARQTTMKEDNPDTGDIICFTDSGDRIILDTKLDNHEGWLQERKNVYGLAISRNTVERIRSGNREALETLLDTFVDITEHSSKSS